MEVDNASFFGSRDLIFSGGTLGYGDSLLNCSTRFFKSFSNQNGQAIKVHTGSANSTQVTFGTAIEGSNNSLEKLGSGELILNAQNTYQGATIVSEGALTLPSVSGGRALSASTSVEIAAGAHLDVDAVTVVGSLSGSGTVDLDRGYSLSFGGAIDAGNSKTFSGIIAGSGDLFKQGSGSSILSGENPGYSGNTVVESGELILSKANALGSGNAISVQDGAMLVLQSSETNPSNFSFENVLSLGSYVSSPSGAALRLNGGSAQLTRPVSIANLSSIALLADGSELILSIYRPAQLQMSSSLIHLGIVALPHLAY